MDDRAGDARLHALHTVDELAQLEQHHWQSLHWSHRIAVRLTSFYGSSVFVGLHVVWFGLWILINAGWFGLPGFDPFPFTLLPTVVGMEAIFLSIFVLISQNRQARQADHRAKVSLQVSAIAEQEVTKALQMLAEIQDALGIRRDDPDARAMQQQMSVKRVAEAINEAEADLDTAT